MKKYALTFVVCIAIVGMVAYVLGNQNQESDVSVNDYIQEGKRFLGIKEYSKALEQYKLAINTDPSNTDIYISAADIYLTKGQVEAAIDLLQNGEKTVTHPDKIHQKIGHILLEKKDTEGAIQYLQKAKDENPNNWENLVDLTKAWSSQEGKREDIIKAWEKAVIDDSKGSTYKQYYLALLKNNDIEPALNHAKEADKLIDLQLPIAESVTNLVSILERMKSDPDDIVQNNALLAYELIRAELYPYAIPLLETVISENDEYYAAYMYLGVSYMQMNNLDDARINLVKATTVDPDEIQPFVFLAQVYTLENNQKKSIDSYQQALTIDKKNEDVRYDFARTLVKFGLYRQSQSEYKELIDMGSENQAKYQIELALILIDNLSEPQEGLKYALEVVDKWQGFETSDKETKALGYDTLGWAYEMVGEKDNALKFLLQAIEVYPYLSSNHYHLGVIYKEIGNLTDAQIYFERAIDLDIEGHFSPLASNELENLDN